MIRDMNEEARSARIRQAVDGDKDALQQLIVSYHPALRAAVDRRIAPEMRRHLDPEDVLQESYAAAFKTIAGRTFDSPGGFYKWLERITLNDLKDRQRALGRRKRDVGREVHDSTRGSGSYLDLANRLSAHDDTPSRDAARGEAVAAVLSSLARLTDEQREVVGLRFLEGKAIPEIAGLLGKSETAIHSLCGRALRSLRASMVSITRYLTHH